MEIEQEILFRLFKENGFLTKKVIDDCEYLPSYNTLLRKGYKIVDLNKKFDIEIYNAEPKQCATCDDPIPCDKKRNVYCSSSCSAKTTNKARGVVKNCNFCFKVLTKRNKSFCSHKCHKNYSYMTDFLDWYVLGKNFSNRAIRKFLTDFKGYSCSICQISEWNKKPIMLEVEHIDGNSENCKKENVCLICPNCHSQTSTYKGKNKGNGRHVRMTRYHEGKSY